MNTELRETPRYKVIGKESVNVLGISHPPGTLFETNGWPPNGGVGIAGDNLPGRRIVAWLADNRFDAFMPEAPWNTDHKRFYLPGASPDPRSVVLRIVPPERQRPGMPKYRALTRLADDPFGSVRRFPHRTIEAGEVVTILSWPNFYEGEFEPANREAQLVIDYFAEARGNPKLLSSPWNGFSEALFLPDLPSAADWGRDFPAVTGYAEEAA